MSAAPIWHACTICHTVDRRDGGPRVHESEILAVLARREAQLSHGACSDPACQAEQARLLRPSTEPAYLSEMQRRREALAGLF